MFFEFIKYVLHLLRVEVELPAQLDAFLAQHLYFPAGIVVLLPGAHGLEFPGKVVEQLVFVLDMGHHPQKSAAELFAFLGAVELVFLDLQHVGAFEHAALEFHGDTVQAFERNGGAERHVEEFFLRRLHLHGIVRFLVARQERHAAHAVKVDPRGVGVAGDPAHRNDAPRPAVEHRFLFFRHQRVDADVLPLADRLQLVAFLEGGGEFLELVGSDESLQRGELAQAGRDFVAGRRRVGIV